MREKERERERERESERKTEDEGGWTAGARLGTSVTPPGSCGEWRRRVEG